MRGTALLRRRVTVALRVLRVLRVRLLVLVLVLLNGVFCNAAHDGTTDCPEEAVVGLVASETTGCTACKSTCKTTFTVLSAIGGLFVRPIGDDRQ